MSVPGQLPGKTFTTLGYATKDEYMSYVGKAICYPERGTGSTEALQGSYTSQ